MENAVKGKLVSIDGEGFVIKLVIELEQKKTDLHLGDVLVIQEEEVNIEE